MFITFEGTEGSGKTTQIRHLARHLESSGRTVFSTRQPGGTELGNRIRRILLDPNQDNIVPKAELLLYVADRVQHLAEHITPALARGDIVICDRYVDATVVYQGVARGLGETLVMQLHELACGGLMPDKTFLLDLPVEQGLGRAWQQINTGKRLKNETRFETEKRDFHQRVREGYGTLARKAPNRFIIINAGKDEEDVRRRIIEAADRLFTLTAKNK